MAFNPTSKHLLYVSNGTDFSNQVDVQNDILGLVGAQRLSRRREEEKNTLLKAKREYQPVKTTLVSHSLGSQYTNYIASPEDHVIQYNPYYTAGAKARANVDNYRTKMDVVSAFAPKANTHTIASPPALPAAAHNIDNIRNAPIFV